MSIILKDEYLETKIGAERIRRRQATNAKTLSQLAEERLVEIQTGQFLPPVEMDSAEPAAVTSSQ